MSEGGKSGVALLVGAGDAIGAAIAGDSPLEATLCA